MDKLSPYDNRQAFELQQEMPKSGASAKQLLHFAQMTDSGLFQQYDYGNSRDNEERYNQPTIP